MAGSLLLLAASHLPAQDDLPFSSGSNGSDGPLVIPDYLPHRQEMAAAFDSARGELVVFGGQNNTDFGDTWIFDGTTWAARLPLNSPSARNNHVMAYDAARQEVVLFGGNASSGKLGDTWVWNGANWTQKNPAQSPTPREGAVMAYDTVNQEVVLFGGYSGSTLGDTWVWNGTSWTQKSPTTSPNARYDAAMVWDGKNNRILLYGGYSGYDDTWSWDGSDWTLIPSAITPGGRYGQSMAYDPVSEKIIMTGAFNNSTYTNTWTFTDGVGWQETFPTILPTGQAAENWYNGAMVFDENLQEVVHIGGYRRSIGNTTRFLGYDGSDWNVINSVTYYFDMRDRLTGIYNFTTIDVPTGVTVKFLQNEGNTPVVWLASDNVTINGTIDLSGQNGYNTTEANGVAKAGPGGYDGGAGGIAFNTSGSYAGTDGRGPGGGTGGTNPFDNNLDGGGSGQYFDIYGNGFLVPLDGGSGGGGSASSDTANGVGGGAGGGAILIASSRDITLNGQILAKGGDHVYSSAAGDYSGWGSGGGVKLVADRLKGNGIIDVRGGNNQTGNYLGRIRLEGYERPLASAAHQGNPSASAPVTDNLAVFLTMQPSLSITQVAGNAVSQPASGDTGNPDVVFSAGGSISIVVAGTNVPDGTPITVKVFFEGGTITLPTSGQVSMNAGSAVLSGTIPSGVGVMQAYAQFAAN